MRPRTTKNPRSGRMNNIYILVSILILSLSFNIRHMFMNFQSNSSKNDSPTGSENKSTSSSSVKSDVVVSNPLNKQVQVVRENKKNRKPRKVFVDIGANCGNTYYKHRQEHKDDADEWEAYLWEPNPQMHQFFLNDLKEEYPDVHIIPYAAGVKDGEVKLFVHQGQEHVTDKSQFRNQGKCDANSPYSPSEGTTMFGGAKAAGEPVNVKVVNFLSWLKELELSDQDKFILKIDAEGAEFEILDQMLSDENDNNICLTDQMKIEFHPKIIPRSADLDSKFETFGDNFPKLFKEKCGHDVNLTLLS